MTSEMDGKDCLADGSLSSAGLLCSLEIMLLMAFGGSDGGGGGGADAGVAPAEGCWG
ncbi:hypothetical protein UVI_02029160 [Ustilaginoidea virens]|uniref:Uncharacterized protein n=1 Tax=Ustilaginoidea virens TaxID=1159556 RepID=A0A1B5KX70_USTVR|nr:hypothetical protein UVI_02029160 [Ustilaginoidea virens]